MTSHAPPAPPSATSTFVMGLIALVLCQILSPFVWMSAHSYEEKCRAMGLQPEGLGFAAKVMGILGTALLLTGILGVLGSWALGFDVAEVFRKN